MRKKLLPLFFLFIVNNPIQAMERRDTSYLPETYYQTFDKHLPLYSGRLFLGYNPEAKGSPFIPEKEWASGDVLYEHIWYKIKNLKLNVHTGELLIQTPSQFTIAAVSHRVRAFSLDGKKFIRIDSTHKGSPVGGFYEILAEGELTVLAKRKAIYEQKIEDLKIEHQFNRADEFYIQRGSEFIKISSKKDLFTMVKDKKKAIKKALRQAKIYFRRNKERVIVTAAETYNRN